MSDNEMRAILAPYGLDEKQVIGLISSIDAWHLRQSTKASELRRLAKRDDSAARDHEKLAAEFRQSASAHRLDAVTFEELASARLEVTP